MFCNARFSSESRNVSMILRRLRSASERNEAVLLCWRVSRDRLTRDHIFIHAARDISQPSYPCMPIRSETLPIRIHRYPSFGQTPRTQLACGPRKRQPPQRGPLLLPVVLTLCASVAHCYLIRVAAPSWSRY